MDLALQLVSSAERTGDVPGKCSYGSRGEARVFFHQKEDLEQTPQYCLNRKLQENIPDKLQFSVKLQF